MAASTEATLITTGMLPMLLLASAALTAPVSIALLALYRRAVLRSMASSGTAEPIPERESSDRAPPPTSALGFEFVDTPASAPAASVLIRRSLWRAALVYAVAGLCYAGTLGGAWMIQAGGEGFVPIRFLWLLSCYAWPTALGIGMLLAVSTRQRLFTAGVYFALLFAVAVGAIVRNDELTVTEVATFWLLTNAPATALLLAFLHRRVRAVGPLVLAFMVLVVTGSQLALSLVGSSESAMRSAIVAGSAVGLGGVGTFVATLVIGALAAAAAGWQCLKWLGHRHRERRSSDQALTLDAMWLLFGMVQSITFAFAGWAWIFTGIVAFGAYKSVTLVGFHAAGLHRASQNGASLLLLRVFALGARSGELFDVLAKRWMRIGDISMIAGPDLATTTIEPHEFLDFVGGRLSRQFVRDADDLGTRMQARALGPDPDGRYRANEFFCHADTWQMVMQRIAATADVVLMDLRSFSSGNQGCQYELQQLIDIVPLERILLLIDGSTDRDFLLQTLQTLWSRAAPDSPNRSRSDPRLRIVDIGRHVEHVMPSLLHRLSAPLEAAGVGDGRATLRSS